MYSANNGTPADDAALDEELFGDFAGQDDNHQSSNLLSDSQRAAATSGISQAQDVSQAMATSLSESDIPSHLSPTSASLRVRSQQYLIPLEPMGHTDARSLDPPTSIPTTTPEFVITNGDGPIQLITENTSWMKARITDVHQLLLHYINLRNSHTELVTNMHKETMLQSETNEALERIREQQDQISEDIPRLQFQIAQLKLDVQNERAARIAAETCVTDVKQRLCAYEEIYFSMQSRLREYEEKEKNWQNEERAVDSLR